MSAIMWLFVMQINGCCYKEQGDNMKHQYGNICEIIKKKYISEE